MNPTPICAADPFALLMNPEAVFQAMDRSDRLSRLQRRVCRPLDKPLIPCVGNRELADYDQQIDETVEAVEPGDE